VRDVKGVTGESVIKPALSGHGSILVEEKHAGDGVFLQKFRRLPHAFSLFRRNKGQLLPLALISGSLDSN
jgi:hypothetical protein